MLSFRVHEFHLGRNHYILLPKLNKAQVRIMARRLSSLGFTVSSSASVVAKSGAQNIHIEPSGFCWSREDPADAILPAVPALLRCPKERIPLDGLQEMYFRVGRSGPTRPIRLTTRIESSALWASLRTADDCGLAPDEHAIASYLLARIPGKVRLLTDFHGGGSDPRVFGKRRFFETGLSGEKAASSLRVAGERARRNSYLPPDGILSVSHSVLPSRPELKSLLSNLGEWCSFTPA